MNIIEVTNLRKSYGKNMALDGIDLSIQEGEVYGFIGPNGAGKSTTIRILLGMLKRDAGQVRIFNKDPWSDAVEIHKKISYIPGDVNLWPNLTGGEVIDYLARLSGNLDKNRKKELLERFQLDPRKKCKSYSKGNRQKVALVSAFLNDADLYIFDEPTSGLDPLMEIMFKEYVNEAKEKGKTVFLSSHILEEVESLCDSVGIIRQGKIVETGSLDELRHLTRTTITVELAEEMELGNLNGVYDISRSEDMLKFSVDSNQMAAVMGALAPMGIKSLKAEPPTLEELFIRHYGEGVEGKETS